MFISCPHKWSKKLNKLLPPETHPFNTLIPDVCIHACVCDMSAECGIKECAFFSLDEKDEEFAQEVQLKMSSGEVDREKHDQEMREIWEKEAQRNLYKKYGDKYVCNQPLIPQDQLNDLIENNLIDISIQEDGSMRTQINSRKAFQHNMRLYLKTTGQQLDDMDD